MCPAIPPAEPRGPLQPHKGRGHGPGIPQVKQAAAKLRDSCFEYVSRIATPGKRFILIPAPDDSTPLVEVDTSTIGIFEVKEVRQSRRTLLSDSDAAYIRDLLSKERTKILGLPLTIQGAIEMIATELKERRTQEESDIRDVVAPVISGTLTLSSGRSCDVQISTFMTKTPGIYMQEEVTDCELTDDSLTRHNEDVVREFVEKKGKRFILRPPEPDE